MWRAVVIVLSGHREGGVGRLANGAPELLVGEGLGVRALRHCLEHNIVGDAVHVHPAHGVSRLDGHRLRVEDQRPRGIGSNIHHGCVGGKWRINLEVIQGGHVNFRSGAVGCRRVWQQIGGHIFHDLGSIVEQLSQPSAVLFNDDLSNHTGTKMWRAVVIVLSGHREGGVGRLANGAPELLVGEGLGVRALRHCLEHNIVGDAVHVHPAHGVSRLDGHRLRVEDQRPRGIGSNIHHGCVGGKWRINLEVIQGGHVNFRSGAVGCRRVWQQIGGHIFHDLGSIVEQLSQPSAALATS